MPDLSRSAASKARTSAARACSAVAFPPVDFARRNAICWPPPSAPTEPLGGAILPLQAPLVPSPGPGPRCCPPRALSGPSALCARVRCGAGCRRRSCCRCAPFQGRSIETENEAVTAVIHVWGRGIFWIIFFCRQASVACRGQGGMGRGISEPVGRAVRLRHPTAPPTGSSVRCPRPTPAACPRCAHAGPLHICSRP